MRQLKGSKVNGVPHSLGEAGVAMKKKRSAKLKPAEFAMLMEEMTTTKSKTKTAKRASSKTKKPVTLSVSKPTAKEKKDIAALAHQVNVVCTPWYSILLSRRMSFFIGLWIGIVGMGLLSLVAWSVIKDQSVLSGVVSVTSTATTTSPSTVTQ